MTCEGPLDCCEETTDHSRMEHSSQGLNEDDVEGHCDNPKRSTV